MNTQFILKKPLLYITTVLGVIGTANVHAITTTTPVTPPSMPQPVAPEACVGLPSNNDRLACYDAIFRPVSVQPESLSISEQAASEAINVKTAEQQQEQPTTQRIAETIRNYDLFGAAPQFDPTTSLLDQRWELSEKSKLGTWQLRAYQPIYLLPAMWTSDKNETPYSPNPQNTVTDPQNLNSTEAKFQLSVKTKAVENIFGDNGDIWLGYTQSSRWQVYNSEESRPFRETNYEPEASIIFRTNYNLLGLHGRLLGLTLNHQSNGRSDPFSRSWNRAILNIGFEKNNFALMLRPWYRFEEDADDDNNPDIKNYIGRGDLTANYKWKDHQFSLMLRHSLKGGDDSHGAAQFDWAFPLSGSLRGHLQIFDGYGESLIDYNHRATYVGLGVSLMNWF
ncbi:MAG: phospholipase A [Acinetobacter populi]|jgi:phospholipase A1|uniref:phospholipase A n=1 Tax=Acinetobacter populi TaxID=1582270 RepID=UPI00235305B1|nr:phospholipase A [Acinetobacter populi]MCH4247792.1 phospholipase A [Acinetobacter populi]